MSKKKYYKKIIGGKISSHCLVPLDKLDELSIDEQIAGLKKIDKIIRFTTKVLAHIHQNIARTSKEINEAMEHELDEEVRETQQKVDCFQIQMRSKIQVAYANRILDYCNKVFDIKYGIAMKPYYERMTRSQILGHEYYKERYEDKEEKDTIFLPSKQESDMGKLLANCGEETRLRIKKIEQSEASKRMNKSGGEMNE